MLPAMESNATLVVLAAFGLLDLILLLVRDRLRQLPELFATWHDAKRAFRGQRTDSRGEDDDPTE